MGNSCFLVSGFVERYLLRAFASAGFEPKTFHIDVQPETTTTLHCWVPKHKGRKPALLLIHGFGPGPIWQWHAQVQELSLHFDLYVPSLLFFSPNSTTSSHRRSEIFQAECIAVLMSTIGVDRFSVVGTSYGGLVAYHLGRLHPDRVVRVVLASSAVNRLRSDTDELLKKADGVVVDSLADMLVPTTPEQFRALLRLVYVRPPPRILPDFLFRDFIQALFAKGRKEKVELLEAITLGRDDNLNISPLQQEVLIIWGRYDQIFPIKKAYELQKIIGDNVKLEIMDNTSHVPQLEKPSLFNEIVKKFLLVPPEGAAHGAKAATE